jgi:hypothetical protein
VQDLKEYKETLDEVIPSLLAQARTNLTECFAAFSENDHHVHSLEYSPFKEIEEEEHPPYQIAQIEGILEKEIRHDAARHLLVVFDPRSDIPSDEWVLKFYKDSKKDTVLGCFTGSGAGRWPPLILPTNSFYYAFEPVQYVSTDKSLADDAG